MTTFRIFISSPGDVAAERDKARQVIEQLERHYDGAARLVPVLWEDLPLGADASFQEGIDLVLSSGAGIDVAVFILWSRLGTPIGGVLTRADGSRYRSGTEREFELMMEARRQSGGERPHLLAYLRRDEGGFKRRLQEMPASALGDAIEQQRLAQDFIEEIFFDPETKTNLRAYHSYREPATFANRLRVHLREFLDSRLEGAALSGARWQGNPYRAFDVFDLEHADLFRGRDREVADLDDLLRRREDLPFVTVIGSSGSGKSSFLRAGLAAHLTRFNLDETVARWRCAVLLPSRCDGDLLLGLARLLGSDGVLPELRENGVSPEDLAASLEESPATAAKLALLPAFDRAARTAGGAVKLLLIVDQLEELHTDPRLTAEARERFFRALQALAASGRCWIVATLRSDFYGALQGDPAFAELKGADGQFDLAFPSPSAMRRMITEPARLAGLAFEQDERTGLSLDQQLLDDASRHPDALPLLEFALHELYERRSGRTLTFASYREMGGLTGAVGQRARTIFSRLPGEVRCALPRLLERLVAIDPERESTPVRRLAEFDPSAAEDAVSHLAGALIEARLLTAGRTGEKATLSLAHEALLTAWDELANWIRENHQTLRLRHRIEQAHARWREGGGDPSLLLAPGLPLEEGRQLLASGSSLLPDSEIRFVEESIREESRRHSRSRRRTALTAAAAVLAAAGLTLWYFQMKASGRLEAERETARTHRRVAEEKLGTLMAKDLVNLANETGRFDLAEKIGINLKDYTNAVPVSGDEIEDLATRLEMGEKIVILIQNSGDMAGARSEAREQVEMAERLFAHNGDDPSRLRLSKNLGALATYHSETEALGERETLLARRETLLPDPDDPSLPADWLGQWANQHSQRADIASSRLSHLYGDNAKVYQEKLSTATPDQQMKVVEAFQSATESLRPKGLEFRDECLAQRRRALELRRRAFAAKPEDNEFLQALGETLLSLAADLGASADKLAVDPALAEQEALIGEATQLSVEYLERSPTHDYANYFAVSCLRAKADFAFGAGNPAEAVAAQAAAVEKVREMVERSRRHPGRVQALVYHLYLLADLKVDTGDRAGGLELVEEARTWLPLLEADARFTGSAEGLSGLLQMTENQAANLASQDALRQELRSLVNEKNEAGMALFQQGQFPEAAAAYAEGLNSIANAHAGPRPADSPESWLLATMLHANRAEALIAAGTPAEAVPSLLEAAKLLPQLRELQPPLPQLDELEAFVAQLRARVPVPDSPGGAGGGR